MDYNNGIYNNRCNCNNIYGETHKNIKSKFALYNDAIRNRTPDAYAIINGGNGYEIVKGMVLFYQLQNGVLVVADVKNLPTGSDDCYKIFGFHIHDGESCHGNEQNQFANAEGHYNPNDVPHPCHSGDLPPLFENQGVAFSVVLTDRFKLSEVMGKSIIIHLMPDDFTTQPSGNSGTMIACGIIMK